MENITNLQKWMHSPPRAGESIDPVISYDLFRTSWYKPLPYIVNPSQKDNELIFPIESKNNILANVTLFMKTPEIVSGDPKVQVALCDNFFHNFIESGTLYAGNDEITTVDSVVFDQIIQLYPIRDGTGKREQYLAEIGNLPELTTFNQQLPGKDLSFPIPFSFSRVNSPPFPLFLTNSPVVLKFKIRDIGKLIRVKIGNDYFPYESGKYNIFIEPFKNPDAVIVYGQLTPGEIQVHQSRTQYMLFDYFEAYDGPEKSGFAFKTIKPQYPARAFFISAQNMDAARVNNLSNYSTDSLDGYLGEGPFKIIQKVPGNVFSNTMSIWSGTASPERPGYYLYPFVFNLGKYMDSGETSAQNLEFELNPGNYNLRIRVYSYRIFKFQNGNISLFQIPNF